MAGSIVDRWLWADFLWKNCDKNIQNWPERLPTEAS